MIIINSIKKKGKSNLREREPTGEKKGGKKKRNKKKRVRENKFKIEDLCFDMYNYVIISIEEC